jgi:hypothetical protein
LDRVNSLVSIAAFVAIVACAVAAETADRTSVTSPGVTGLTLTIMRSDPELDDSEARLLYGISVASKDPIAIATPKNLEYVAKIEMVDAEGNALPKTELGRRCGSHFAEVDESYDDKRRPIFKRMELGKVAWQSRSREPAAWRVLPRPSDLFEIQKPGEYRMTVQIQVLRFVPGQTSASFTRVRFPLLTLPVRRQKS